MKSEAQIRDFLVERLDLIAKGLVLVEKEYQLPNAKGAKGFIDILARDEHGMFVIVELKRSNSTSRQALHELYKYTALFAANHGVGPKDVRCVLVSTEWHELRVPFAQFLASSEYHVEGRILELGADGLPVATTSIAVEKVAVPLEVCPSHIVYLYRREEARDLAVSEVRNGLDALGVSDYFLIALDCGEPAERRVAFPFAVYVVLAELPPSLRLSLEQSGVAVDAGDEASDDDWAHEEAVFSHLNKALDADDVEIGYPDKLVQVLDGGWTARAVERSGRFRSVVIWSDQRLVDAAASRDGGHATRFEGSASPRHAARWSAFLAGLGACLTGTDPWPEVIDALLAEVAQNDAEALVEAKVFSPADVLWALYALADGNPLYVPTLNIVIRGSSGAVLHILGTLFWDGASRPAGLRDTVESVLDGGLDEWFLARHFGEQRSFESELAGRHGLRYALVEVAGDPGNERVAVSWSDPEGLVREPLPSSPLIVFDFPAANESYLKGLSEAINARTIGPGLFRSS